MYGSIKDRNSIADLRSTMRGCRLHRRLLAKRRGVSPRCSRGQIRSQYRCLSEVKNNGMTTLDHRLYAWLLESNEQRFERAFKAYFDVAFPSVIRYLARLSHWDPAYLEEMAQDALLRFFDKVGRSRREASEAVRASLAQLRPLNLGVFHERQALTWINEIGTFRDSAVNFRLPESDDLHWKASIRTLAERIPVLQRAGCHLLHSVHLELRWTFDDANLTPVPTTDLPGDTLDQLASGSCEERLVEEMLTETARAVTAEHDYPGAMFFVKGTWSVVRALPHLRVPTNGYLFEIASTIYLDECKKRGRRKRGGIGAVAIDHPDAVDLEYSGSNHPIDRLSLESVSADDDEERYEGVPAKTGNSSLTFPTMPSVDPNAQFENEDLFERFYEYLRKPVEEAMQAFHQAQSAGRAFAERRKLDSLTERFSRTMSVLSDLGEGYTQEQTAERLSLSRNQVKYIIEQVQGAYAGFTADTARLATRPNVSGVPHVV